MHDNSVAGISDTESIKSEKEKSKGLLNLSYDRSAELNVNLPQVLKKPLNLKQPNLRTL